MKEELVLFGRTQSRRDPVLHSDDVSDKLKSVRRRIRWFKGFLEKNSLCDTAYDNGVSKYYYNYSDEVFR